MEHRNFGNTDLKCSVVGRVEGGREEAIADAVSFGLR